MVPVSLTVNGKAIRAEIEPRTLLVQLLRDRLGLTGTHIGCDTSQCGACVVHLNGKAVKSCTVLALSCEGAKVTTIEGVGSPAKIAPDAAGISESSCVAMRFLHAGNDHVCARYCQAQGSESSTKPRSAKNWKAISAAARATTILSGQLPPARRRWGRPECRLRNRGSAMSETGVGKSVKRREDIRFITGSGRYTADINRAGQAYAVFVRSPHAHARIRRIDVDAALHAPGVVGIFTGKELEADRIGKLICGWMIHSKDGSPDESGCPSSARTRSRSLCR